METKYTDIHRELIEKCRRGDSKAQFEIYKLYYKAMYNTCLRLVNDSMEAEDIMQESFLSAFKNIDSFREEVSFGAWLKRIVVNRSLDALKKRRIAMTPLEDERLAIADELEPVDYESMAQKVAEIKQLIIQMPENYRVLLTLHLIEGYDHDEIAEILDMNNGAVRTGYSRARQKLVEMLNKKKIDIWTN